MRHLRRFGPPSSGGFQNGREHGILGKTPRKLYPAMLWCEGKSRSLGYCKNRNELVDGVVEEQIQPPPLPAARPASKMALPAVVERIRSQHELKARSASSRDRTRGT